MPILLQIFEQPAQWHSGYTLIPAEIVEKEEAHDKELLHLSAHLLILDSDNRILSRKRKEDDFRYAGLWTSTLGTHVLLGSDYLTTLQDLLPISKKITWIGEFRVHDKWENEVNGLFVMRADQNELTSEFLTDRQFFTDSELNSLIEQNKTTPHLKGGFELLQMQSAELLLYPIL